VALQNVVYDRTEMRIDCETYLHSCDWRESIFYMIKVAIFGGKGGGTLAAQTVQALSRVRGSHQLIGYLNDRLDVGTSLHGGAVIGRFEDWRKFEEDVAFVAPLHKAGAMPANARRIIGLDIPPSRWAVLVDPLANTADNAIIGGGSVVSAMTQIGPDSCIGSHCFLRAGAIVSHDVTISNYVYLGQTSVAAGYSRIETGAHIAPGAIVRDGITVGQFALVGMGAVVTKDVPPFAIVNGVPAGVTGSVEPAD
jgi:carbonic anhydrase/acetyltransferase-like protein (isoleucine patch superfamily)